MISFGLDQRHHQFARGCPDRFGIVFLDGRRPSVVLEIALIPPVQTIKRARSFALRPSISEVLLLTQHAMLNPGYVGKVKVVIK